MSFKTPYAVVILACAASVSAQTNYTAIDLGTLGGPQTTPSAINSSGEITGVSNTAVPGVGYAFKWSPPNGPIQSVGNLPGGPSSAGFSINDSGWITGEGGASEAFVYTPQSGMQPLGFLGTGTISQGNCVNNEGVIAGVSATTGSTNLNPFIWTESGGMVDLNKTIANIPSGWTPTSANLINNNGLIVGIGYPDLATYPPSGLQHAFALNAGTLTEIPDPAAPNGLGIQPEGLNESGEVVGVYFGAGGSENAFVYTKAQGTQEIMGLGGSQTAAFDVNDEGEIVGGTTLSDGDYRAFVYTEANGIIDLNSLAVVNGWTLDAATGINDAGQIIAQGMDSAGDYHAFLLTPTPEPPTLAILTSLALVIITVYGRHRRAAARAGNAQRGHHI